MLPRTPPSRNSLLDIPLELLPPAADSRAKAIAPTSVAPWPGGQGGRRGGSEFSAPENRQPRPALPLGTLDKLLPTGPIGETMKHRL